MRLMASTHEAKSCEWWWTMILKRCRRTTRTCYSLLPYKMTRTHLHHRMGRTIETSYNNSITKQRSKSQNYLITKDHFQCYKTQILNNSILRWKNLDVFSILQIVPALNEIEKLHEIT